VLRRGGKKYSGINKKEMGRGTFLGSYSNRIFYITCRTSQDSNRDILNKNQRLHHGDSCNDSVYCING
jgi:hypothetical protein